MPRFTHTKIDATPLQSLLVTLLVCLAFLCASCMLKAQLATPAFSGHVSQAIASSRVVGRLPSSQRLTLALGLPLRNQAELDSLLADLADPTSPSFHHYLTPEQFAARFGPTEADYQALIQFAQQNNLTVTQTHGNRAVLTVTAVAADVEQAFTVHLNMYQHPTRGQFFAADRQPSSPIGLPLQDVSGLDDFAPPRPMSLTQQTLTASHPNVTGSGPYGYLIGNDFRNAYAPAVTLTGSGQAVGLIEFDGFYPGDVAKNFAAAKLPAVPVQTVLLDGFNGSAGSANVEVILDIMMASYMAPGVSKVIVYEGSTPNDILNRMATDNLAAQLSSSWGFTGVNATTEQIFKQFAAQGQTMMQASGDSGAYTNGVMSPSDDPALTVVGGTSLVTAGASGAWLSETTWAGSGGGVSTKYAIPSWQQSVSGMAARGGSTTMRNIPDVALTADIEMYLVCNNGQAISVGGTSAAAPLWAGFLALANQQAAARSKPRIGFLNPLLYALGESGSFGSDLNDIRVGSNGAFKALPGYDLTTGWGSPSGQHLIDDLTGTSTTPSFTLATSVANLTAHPSTIAAATIVLTKQNGFSSPVALTLTGLPAGVTATFGASTISAAAVPLTLTISSSAPAGTYPLTITGTSGKLSSTASLILTITVPTFTLAPGSPSLSVVRPGTVSTNLVVSAQDGFTGAVTFSTSSLPVGLSAVFPTTAPSSSPSITFAATTAAQSGTYAIEIKGTSGRVTASTSISLTVMVPGFTLSTSPANLALLRGTTAQGSLVVTPVGGFNSAVTVTASGVPAGVTFASAPFTSAHLSALTFTSTSAALPGTYSITINGASGSIIASTKLTLVIPAAATGDTFVNLASAYNINAIVQDNVPFSGAGIDGGLNGSSTAYSATLLGVSQTAGGSSFYFGAANALDAVSGKTVPLPAGLFTSLKLLATGVNGPQLQQPFKITYSDGSSTIVTQSLSDWFTPQKLTGETTALSLLYRDNGAGQIDNRTFYLYEYSLPLNSAKVVSSITFPANRNVVVLAATLASASASVR